MDAQAPVAPFRASHPDVYSVPLQSDAPWIRAGIVGVTVVCIAIFVPLFVHGQHHPLLGLIPAMAVAVFAGSALAAYGRTLGGTATLDVSPGRVTIHEHGHGRALLERGLPWSASLLVDPRPGRRMLVIGQRNDTFIVMEPAPVGSTRQPADSRWRDRTVEGDLDALAISPASASVLTLGRGHSLDRLLDVLGGDLDPATPWLQHQLVGGEVLRVTATEFVLGIRRVPLGADTRVLPYALEAGRGTPLAALAVMRGEYSESTVLLACDEAGVMPGAVVSDIAPDAFVPLHVYETLRTLLA